MFWLILIIGIVVLANNDAPFVDYVNFIVISSGACFVLHLIWKAIEDDRIRRSNEEWRKHESERRAAREVRERNYDAWLDDCEEYSTDLDRVLRLDYEQIKSNRRREFIREFPNSTDYLERKAASEWHGFAHIEANRETHKRFRKIMGACDACGASYASACSCD